MQQSQHLERLWSWLERWRQRLVEWIDRHEIPEPALIMLTSLVVGIGAGLGAVAFRWLIGKMQWLAYDGLGGLLQGIAPFHLLIIPAVGGAIFGPLIYRFAREAKGHGVPEVMEAVALRGGRIRPRVALVKALASSICIGSGGSVGREGPIAQIGSALGSTVGQVLRLSDDRVRTLVACGAAGGIAATFNAPIAGAIFALEVILGQLHTLYFGAVVISAVTADVITHLFLGNSRAFAVPEYTLVNPWELALYALLGAVAAVAAVAFTRLLYFSEDVWDELRLPEYVKPVLGGLALGLLGLLTFKIDGFPRIFGVGYESIDDAMFGNLTFQMTVALFLLKMLATSLTLGSGGSGGVFAPSLFMGAMVGGTFGQIVHRLLPSVTAPAGAYALVGTAALFSGAAHAPVTAILILFEMTGNYSIILPLMLATVTSTLISRAISRESIYTLKLTRRGVRLQRGHDIDVMQGIEVSEAMTTDVDTVPADIALAELARAFAESHHHGFPVLDENGDLYGVVTIQDMERAMSRADASDMTVRDIATTTLQVAYPDEPLWAALKRMGTRDVGRLPVVSRENPNRLLGLIRRADIIRAYNKAITRRMELQHRTDRLRLGRLTGVQFVETEVGEDAEAVGKPLSQADLPHDCVLVSVRRGRKLIIPHGDTVLEPGDRITALLADECLDDFYAWSAATCRVTGPDKT